MTARRSLREIVLQTPRDAAFEPFLRLWHGPPSVPRVSAPERAMPQPLRIFYEIVGAWPNAFAFNDLLRPPELDGGKLVFCAENQGVCLWATVPHDVADAPVWSSLLFAEREPWTPEEPLLDGFLLQLLLFEALWAEGPGASAANVERDRLGDVTAPLEEVPFGAWRWPFYPTRFWVGDRVIVVAGPNPYGDEVPETSRYVSVWVGALDDDALAYLADVVDDSWEYYSPHDGVAT